MYFGEAQFLNLKPIIHLGFTDTVLKERESISYGLF